MNGRAKAESMSRVLRCVCVGGVRENEREREREREREEIDFNLFSLTREFKRQFKEPDIGV